MLHSLNGSLSTLDLFQLIDGMLHVPLIYLFLFILFYFGFEKSIEAKVHVSLSSKPIIISINSLWCLFIHICLFSIMYSSDLLVALALHLG